LKFEDLILRDPHGLIFPILLDSRSEVSNAYGARQLPASFLLNPSLQVVAAARDSREWDSPGACSYLAERLSS
jgi:hypothetical protein